MHLFILLLIFWTALTRNSSFSINPYLLALVEWRNAMNEEAAALVHASKGMNKALKTVVTISLIFIISWIEYGGEHMEMDVREFACVH